MKTILTGIKPTGQPHVGNYVGMVKPTLSLIDSLSSNDQALVFIANYHALNHEQDRIKVRDNTYAIAAAFLALGLDPNQAIFYRQSDVPEIFELTTVLTNFAPKGLMNRAHAYKDKVARNRKDYEEKGVTNNEMDLDRGINMGLFNYPILMAADILLFQSTDVPVGKDQTQHIEIARDIAKTFNHVYGDTFTFPQAYYSDTGAQVPGLNGEKMSKSKDNTIPIFAKPSEMRKLVMKIQTDSKSPEEPKVPEESTIFQLYQQFATCLEIEEMRQAFLQGGVGYGALKAQLADVMDRALDEPRQKYIEYIQNSQLLDSILRSGGEKARYIAHKTIKSVRHKIGV